MEHPSIQLIRTLAQKQKRSYVSARIEGGELIQTRRDGTEDNLGPIIASASHGGGQTVGIAASDSTDLDKAGADLVCPGVDDDVAIMEILDELLPAGGGVVRFAAGNYWFSGTVSAEHTIFEGCGEGCYINIDPHETAFCPEIDGIIRGFNFELSESSLDDGPTFAVGSGDIFTADPGGLVEACRFENVHVQLSVDGSCVKDCKFTGSDHGADTPIVDVYAPYDTSVINCFFVDCDQYGAPGPGFSTLTAINAYGPVIGCKFSGGYYRSGIDTNGPIIGCMVGQNYYPEFDDYFAYSSYGPISGNDIQCVIIHSFDDSGYGVLNCDGPIEGNYIYVSDGEDVVAIYFSSDYTPCTGNKVDIYGDGGIAVLVNASMCTVTGNHLSAYRYGIWLSSGGDNIAAHNTIYCDGAVGVQDDGTGNITTPNIIQ